MNYWTPLNYEGFEQYLMKKSTHKYFGGFQYEFQFDNGFGASVIKHDESYGNVDDLFELGVLDENGELKYGEGHLNMNLFHISVIADIAQNELPYHVAHKKCDYMNENGEMVFITRIALYKDDVPQINLKIDRNFLFEIKLHKN